MYVPPVQIFFCFGFGCFGIKFFAIVADALLGLKKRTNG